MIAAFGVTANAQPVQKITLQNPEMTVAVLTYGAALQSVRLAGVAHDLTLGSDRLADYEGPMPYHGTLVGPLANRLAGAEAMLGSDRLRFAPNDGPHLLHAGPQGIHRRVWTVQDVQPDRVTLALTLTDDGFPGQRMITACYAISGAVLRLEVTATTDAPTLMNIAQHSYWNLDGARTWSGHSLQIAAETYLPTDAGLIPTGEVRPVTGTPFDFRKARHIVPGDPAMDMNFCVSTTRTALREVLWLSAGQIRMAFATTEPGVQVYDGAAGIRPGHSAYEGLAIEAQGWPDAPHHPHFPSVGLEPGETYQQTTEWRFSRL